MHVKLLPRFTLQSRRYHAAFQLCGLKGYAKPCYQTLRRLSSASAPPSGPVLSVPHAVAASPIGAAVESTTDPHVSVLLQEIIEFFEPCKLEAFVDGTLGAGGHSAALMARHMEMKFFLGIDMDATARALAVNKLNSQQRAHLTVHVEHGNFRNLKSIIAGLQKGRRGFQVNGVLLDLGMSSMQVDAGDRGFSFMKPGPIDMRMDRTANLSAADILNQWPEGELGRIFREYGEERYWRKLAARVVEARSLGPIETTGQLVGIIGQPGGFPRRSAGQKGSGGKQIHPATRVFQALRIAVNDELSSIEKAIPDAIDCLAPGGRLGVISFHSLEDRIVKRAFLKAAGKDPENENLYVSRSQLLQQKDVDPVVKILTKRPVTAGEEEIARNPRSRSAKLRFLEKL